MSSSYVSVMEHGAAVQLTGNRALCPLTPGQTVVGHGTYDDRAETGASIFLVLRDLGHHTYVMAPMGSLDPYWGDRLSKRPQVKAQLMWSPSDAVPDG